MLSATQNRAFLPINADLINNPAYQHLSNDALMLYSLYQQRQQVSAYHADNDNPTFVDDQGVFVYFSNEEAAKILRISVRKVSSLRSALIKCGLIHVVRNGLKNFKIYVNQPQETPADVELILPWANFSFEKPQVTDKQVDANVPADFASTEKQILPINQSNSKQSKLNITSETNESGLKDSVVIDEQPKPKDPVSLEKTAVDSLMNRLSNMISTQVAGRVRILTNNSYKEAKALFDMIFKAKSQVTNRLFTSPTWMYDDAATKATRFETNNVMTKGLESALLRISEALFKQNNVIKNKERFMYVYLRNFMASAVQNFLNDNYELTEDDQIDLKLLMNFSA